MSAIANFVQANVTQAVIVSDVANNALAMAENSSDLDELSLLHKQACSLRNNFEDSQLSMRRASNLIGARIGEVLGEPGGDGRKPGWRSLPAHLQLSSNDCWKFRILAWGKREMPELDWRVTESMLLELIRYERAIRKGQAPPAPKHPPPLPVPPPAPPSHPDLTGWDPDPVDIEPGVQVIPAPPPLPPQLPRGAQRAKGTGNNEWFTPRVYIEAARKVMGTIDLDPASCTKANRTVKATQFYTKEANGLNFEWNGNIWMNPPYSQPDITHFFKKLYEERMAGRVQQAITLTHASPDAAWFHDWGAKLATALCLTLDRVKFISPDDVKAQPTQGQALLYLGDKPDKFLEVFSELGTVWKAYT